VRRASDFVTGTRLLRTTSSSTRWQRDVPRVHVAVPDALSGSDRDATEGCTFKARALLAAALEDYRAEFRYNHPAPAGADRVRSRGPLRNALLRLAMRRVVSASRAWRSQPFLRRTWPRSFPRRPSSTCRWACGPPPLGTQVSDRGHDVRGRRPGDARKAHPEVLRAFGKWAHVSAPAWCWWAQRRSLRRACEARAFASPIASPSRATCRRRTSPRGSTPRTSASAPVADDGETSRVAEVSRCGKATITTDLGTHRRAVARPPRLLRTVRVPRLPSSQRRSACGGPARRGALAEWRCANSPQQAAGRAPRPNALALARAAYLAHMASAYEHAMATPSRRPRRRCARRAAGAPSDEGSALTRRIAGIRRGKPAGGC